jgi:hypothetical protein
MAPKEFSPKGVIEAVAKFIVCNDQVSVEYLAAI